MVYYERVFHYYFIPYHKNRVATKHKCDKYDVSWCATRGYSITILYHAIKIEWPLNTSVTSAMFHGVLREGIPLLFYTIP